ISQATTTFGQPGSMQEHRGASRAWWTQCHMWVRTNAHQKVHYTASENSSNVHHRYERLRKQAKIETANEVPHGDALEREMTKTSLPAFHNFQSTYPVAAILAEHRHLQSPTKRHLPACRIET